jgi:hypothetical protein
MQIPRAKIVKVGYIAIFIGLYHGKIQDIIRLLCALVGNINDSTRTVNTVFHVEQLGTFRQCST